MDATWMINQIGGLLATVIGISRRSGSLVDQLLWNVLGIRGAGDLLLVALFLTYAVLSVLFALLVVMIVYPWHPSDANEQPMLAPRHARRLHRLGTVLLAILFVALLAIYEIWLAGEDRSWGWRSNETSWTLLLVAVPALCLSGWHFARWRIINQLAEHRTRLGAFCAAALAMGLLVQYRNHFDERPKWNAAPMPLATPQAWPKAMVTLGQAIARDHGDRSTVLLLIEPGADAAALYVLRFRSALAPSQTLIIDRPTGSGAVDLSAAAGSDLARQRWDAAHPEWFAAAIARHPEARIVVSMVGLPSDHRSSPFCKRLAQPGAPLLILADLRGLYPERWLSVDDHLTGVLTAKPGVRVHPTGPADPLDVDILYRLEPAPTRPTRPGDPRH